jgi:hypothetical protein
MFATEPVTAPPVDRETFGGPVTSAGKMKVCVSMFVGFQFVRKARARMTRAPEVDVFGVLPIVIGPLYRVPFCGLGSLLLVVYQICDPGVAVVMLS